LTWREGRQKDAQRLLDAARILNRTLGSREHEAQVLAGTARLLRDRGQPEAAWQLLAQARAIFETIGPAYEARKVRTELTRDGFSPPQPRR